MEHKKPIAAFLVGVVAANAITDAYLGLRLLTDLPPLASATLGSTASTFTGSALPIWATPTYNSVTDERIEAPVIEKDKSAQS
jgi:hypothetical protein